MARDKQSEILDQNGPFNENGNGKEIEEQGRKYMEEHKNDVEFQRNMAENQRNIKARVDAQEEADRYDPDGTKSLEIVKQKDRELTAFERSLGKPVPRRTELNKDLYKEIAEEQEKAKKQDSKSNKDKEKEPETSEKKPFDKNSPFAQQAREQSKWDEEYKTWFWKSFGYKVMWILFICGWILAAVLLVMGMVAGFGKYPQLHQDLGWTFLAGAIVSAAGIIVVILNKRFDWKLWRKAFSKKKFLTNGEFEDKYDAKKELEKSEDKVKKLEKENRLLKGEVSDLRYEKSKLLLEAQKDTSETDD